MIRIGEGSTTADRHETRVAVFREDHAQQPFCAHLRNAINDAPALRNVLVGRARFELAVSWSQTRRFTELSHRPLFRIGPSRLFDKPRYNVAVIQSAFRQRTF